MRRATGPSSSGHTQRGCSPWLLASEIRKAFTNWHHQCVEVLGDVAAGEAGQPGADRRGMSGCRSWNSASTCRWRSRVGRVLRLAGVADDAEHVFRREIEDRRPVKDLAARDARCALLVRAGLSRVRMPKASMSPRRSGDGS